MNILFKRLNEFAVIPTRADDLSAGYDLSIPNDPETHYSNLILNPGERKLFKLGFSTEIVRPKLPYINTDMETYIFSQNLMDWLPDGFQIEIRPRSGNALKKGLTVLNTPGTIDESYRGEWGVILYNAGDVSIQLSPGDKIAQAVLMPYWSMEFRETEDLSDTERGTGGFGSSDKK